jgi:hypothetical protein
MSANTLGRKPRSFSAVDGKQSRVYAQVKLGLLVTTFDHQAREARALLNATDCQTDGV